jgi:hypothetical protein
VGAVDASVRGQLASRAQVSVGEKDKWAGFAGPCAPESARGG